METYLSTVNRDILCELLPLITDYAQIWKLVIALGERGNVALECVRNIFSNSDENQYPFTWQSIYSFPRLERVDIILRVRNGELQSLAFHPSLKKFRVLLLGDMSLEYTELLNFVTNYISGSYEWQGQRIQSNRNFRDTFIVVRMPGLDYQTPLLILARHHLFYLAPMRNATKYLSNMLKLVQPRELWSSASIQELTGSFERLHHIVEVSPRELASYSHRVYDILSSSYEEIITKKFALHFIEVADIDIRVAFITLVDLISQQLLRSPPDISRWTEIRMPLLVSSELPQLIEAIPQLPEYELILVSLTQLSQVPQEIRGKKVRVYSSPGVKLREDIPEYPVYLDEEALLRAYVGS